MAGGVSVPYSMRPNPYRSDKVVIRTWEDGDSTSSVRELPYTSGSGTVYVPITEAGSYLWLEATRKHTFGSTQLNSNLVLSGQTTGNAITSGTLEIGKRYKITNYVSSDDFTNVGANENETGEIFTAIGTTPTVWTNSSTLYEFTTESLLVAPSWDLAQPSSLTPVATEGGVELSWTDATNPAIFKGYSITGVDAYDPPLKYQGSPQYNPTFPEVDSSQRKAHLNFTTSDEVGDQVRYHITVTPLDILGNPMDGVTSTDWGTPNSKKAVTSTGLGLGPLLPEYPKLSNDSPTSYTNVAITNVNTVDNLLYSASHGLEAGWALKFTGTDLPDPLAQDTWYYVVDIGYTDWFAVATSINDTNLVVINDVGSGSMTWTAYPPMLYVYYDTVSSIDTDNDLINFGEPHAFATGDWVKCYACNGGTEGGYPGISGDTAYYVVKVSTNHIALKTSATSSSYVNLTSGLTGTLEVVRCRCPLIFDPSLNNEYLGGYQFKYNNSAAIDLVDDPLYYKTASNLNFTCTYNSGGNYTLQTMYLEIVSKKGISFPMNIYAEIDSLITGGWGGGAPY